MAGALGRRRGDYSTTVHVRIEHGGKLLIVLLAPGERHEHTVSEQLMEQGAVKRASCGRPRLRSRRAGGDNGYSSETMRRYLGRRGSGALIPRKKNERSQPRFDRAVYRELINGFKRYRRIGTHYEKRAANYAVHWIIAAILDWL